MLKDNSYNQLKGFRFAASLIVLCAYIAAISLENILPPWLLQFTFAAALIVFVISILRFSFTSQSSRKVMQDEVTVYHEKKACEFIFGVLAATLFAGIIFTQITARNIVLTYEVLVCMLVAIFTISDGYYLLLEKRGGNHAENDDED